MYPFLLESCFFFKEKWSFFLNYKTQFESWYAPKTPWPIIKKNWLRLNTYYSFNRKQALKEVQQIKKSFELKPHPPLKKKPLHFYRGICFKSKKMSKDPLYEGLGLFLKNNKYLINSGINIEDGVSLGASYEKNFTQKTEIYRGYLAEILDKFQSCSFKIRLLELKKGGELPLHVDIPYYRYIRLHTVLQTNEKSFWCVGGEKFQIPADGHWYWIDSGKPHSVWNYGHNDRIVLNINLCLYEKDGKIINKDRDFEELITSKDL